MIKRKTFTLRGGEVIDVEEFHDGRYGAPGEKRQKKKKPTKEQMQMVNRENKKRRARLRLIEYFSSGDWLITLTYQVRYRPADMAAAAKHFAGFRKKVAKEYKKREAPLFWIRNIERGTKGAWHVHLVITAIPDTLKIVSDAWPYGYINHIRIGQSEQYDEDFSQLAGYLTKDEHYQEEKKDGEPSKPRIRESSYSISRNMPLPEPHVDKLARWKKEPKPKKGYYIAKNHTGVNPFNGYEYRRYTMIRLDAGTSAKVLGRMQC